MGLTGGLSRGNWEGVLRDTNNGQIASAGTSAGNPVELPVIEYNSNNPLTSSTDGTSNTSDTSSSPPTPSGTETRTIDYGKLFGPGGEDLARVMELLPPDKRTQLLETAANGLVTALTNRTSRIDEDNRLGNLYRQLFNDVEEMMAKERDYKRTAAIETGPERLKKMNLDLMGKMFSRPTTAYNVQTPSVTLVTPSYLYGSKGTA